MCRIRSQTDLVSVRELGEEWEENGDGTEGDSTGCDVEGGCDVLLCWNRGDSAQQRKWVPQPLRRRRGNRQGPLQEAGGCSQSGAPSSGNPDRHSLFRAKIGWIRAEEEKDSSRYPECKAALGKVRLGCGL